ncbi:hypothetical protein [Metaclostridioides mangenotii]|uniref:hypothetical protein n=1 Tax=Metaclostridioides mangenotii TaxID=1540 RepID=UPI0028E37292|nr:hypothetical protein [Clostridioides mangenotii]
MNKKISIVAIVMLVVGIIGTVWSFLYATPSISDFRAEKEYQANQEYNIYEEKEDINKLAINSYSTNIIIKHHNKDSVLVTKKGVTNNLNYSISNKDKTLIVEEDKNRIYGKKITDIDSMVRTFIDEIFVYEDISIIIYLPNKVDLNLAIGSGDLNIKDDIFLNEFKLTSDGTFRGDSMPKEIQNLKTLDIKSYNDISMPVTSIIGIKDIILTSNSVDIYSNDDENIIEDIESKLPENITILEQDIGENLTGSVGIESQVPVAKNLNIEAPNSVLTLNLPTNKYKFNYNVHSEQRNDLNYEDLKYDEDGNEIKEDIIDINGLVDKALEKLETQYNVKANAGYLKKK